MDFEAYRALYLHIPFCVSRCRYCDFHTCAVAKDSPEIESYVDSLLLAIRDASKQGELGSIETVYLGGGTPSYIGNKQLTRILYGLSLFMHLTPEVECSLEANPESLTRAMVKDLFALGVTRISLGVQSFHDDLLSLLGRPHTADMAKKAIETAQFRFDNVSIDLMCGLPYQTEEMFRADLNQAVNLGVKHVSIYPLTIEQGTVFSNLVEHGKLSVDEDAAAQMMEIAAELLCDAGMERYEVASYAYPGYASRHNCAYWTGKPYLGLGEGAVSMKQNAQERIRFNQEGIIEKLSYEQRLIEDVMLGMRMSRGVESSLIQEVNRLVPNTQSLLDELVEDGYVEQSEGFYRPTEKGWLFGNVLYGRIFDLAS